MKKAILLGLILFFLSLIPFTSSSATTAKTTHIQICEYSSDWELV